jgi:hypothetical protein
MSAPLPKTEREHSTNGRVGPGAGRGEPQPVRWLAGDGQLAPPWTVNTAADMMWA